NPSQCLFTRQGVVREYQIKIHRQSRHVAHKEVDGRTTFQGKRVIHKDQWCHLCQQACCIEIRRIHGFSTNRPSLDLDTQGRSLPVGNVSGSSFSAHGNPPSRPSWRQSRTVLTLVQCCNSSRSTLTRKL